MAKEQDSSWSTHRRRRTASTIGTRGGGHCERCRRLFVFGGVRNPTGTDHDRDGPQWSSGRRPDLTQSCATFRWSERPAALPEIGRVGNRRRSAPAELTASLQRRRSGRLERGRTLCRREWPQAAQPLRIRAGSPHGTDPAEHGQPVRRRGLRVTGHSRGTNVTDKGSLQ